MIRKPTKQQQAEGAERYQLAQAQRMLDLFEEARGRPARTVRELERWATTKKGRAILAFYLDERAKLIPSRDMLRQAR